MIDEVQLPEILLKHIEIGKAKASEHYARKECEWHETTEAINKAWNDIENQIKAILPEEVREYFVVDRPRTLSLEEATRGYGFQNGLSQDLVDELKKQIPEICLIGRQGYLEIPNLDRVDVRLYSQESTLAIWYTGPTARYNEQDGSLEMALYYAKVSYDNDDRRRWPTV